MKKIVFLLGRREQPRLNKYFFYLHDKPNEPIKEGPLSFVLFESPFISVSTVSRWWFAWWPAEFVHKDTYTHPWLNCPYTDTFHSRAVSHSLNLLNQPWINIFGCKYSVHTRAINTFLFCYINTTKTILFIQLYIGMTVNSYTSVSAHSQKWYI